MGNGTNESDIPRPDGLVLAPFRALRYDPSPGDLAPALAPPYDGGGAASRLVADGEAHDLVADVVTPDGIGHRVWAVTDAAVLANVAADLHERRAVIADGHHRYATFLRYQADRHAAGDGNGPW